ncbi:hypothetical protein MEO40_27575 [Dolichospermum sp. ST_sed1]|nr:hypothetical protein [Dolichospermum sp. ST_sed1]
MINKIKKSYLDKIFAKLSKLIAFPGAVLNKLSNIQESLGRIEGRINICKNSNISDSEFKVYSQWGEDGIIQYLINNINIKNKIFIEFGVENYKESNTRFLLINDNWSGLVIDGCPKNIEVIRNDAIYWRFNLKAEASFITAENIDSIFANNGISGDIGLLSVDIDGNDYWVWENIHSISPSIVICEYNSLFGPTKKITTPYKKDFVRFNEHYSYVYYGASIAALNDLAISKGYSLVYGNSNGNNVFFVRNDLLSNLKTITPEEAYVKAKFQDSRDSEGYLNYLTFDERVKLISDLDVFDLNKKAIVKLVDYEKLLNINHI